MQQVTINPISGRWATQFGPEVSMRTTAFADLLSEDSFNHPVAYESLDVLFGCLLFEAHTTLMHEGKPAEYVCAWKVVDSGTGVHLGVRAGDTVVCYVSAFMNGERKKKCWMIHDELIAKLIALTNASHKIFELGGAAVAGLKHNDGEFIRVVDMGNPFDMRMKPPQGGSPTEMQYSLASALSLVRKALGFAEELAIVDGGEGETIDVAAQCATKELDTELDLDLKRNKKVVKGVAMLPWGGGSF
mmetsp:Transcript_18517/g.41407  ORF Transcript_18517/g.41407 Transcript_18517/m.41407 type:complete len:245 (-) Transcript_18517:560-1294(-)